jgi:hypothetical protein
MEEAERSSAAAHLASCAGCGGAHARLVAERDLFVQEAALPQLAADALARSETHRRWPVERIFRRLVPFGLLAGAAAVALFLGPTGERTKGGFSLSPYVLHPERSSAGALHLGEPLHPGDQLQFKYSGTAGYLSVVAVDATGKVSVFYPPGPTAARVAAGRDVALDTAVELDGTLGQEVIVGVRCEDAVAVAEVVRATRSAAEAARARGVAPTQLGALGLPCVETRHQIAKAERPSP